jgi:hypothetical protein
MSLTYDEVSTIDNQNWLSIHAYMVQNWLQIPILLCLDEVARSSIDNLIQIFMQALMHEKGLTKDLIGKKLLTFIANGIPIFQSIRLVVIWEISNVWTPHSMGVHYMAHKINFVV